MNEFQTMKDLKEEFREYVLSSFLVLIGAIISIVFGNLTKSLFDANVSVWLYIIACYVVPFIFMILEFWLVARIKRIVKEINQC
ncbi:hypothetical protein P4J09_19605 [Bacillus cereus]|uniref:hypothetical protein n=1 Tax=Bacillus cereus TaxID=1396 RepID=UPI001122C269|nr:hypothetical protein [Bacillus cereus]MEB9380231.1 hypothetical protein [Bacillus cereus]UDW09530.1 hypothetical protein FHP23_029680 [Bacillus cereus]